MRYGETGVNLEIDLSRGSIEKEESDPRLTELHLGGHGTNAKILWDRVPPEVKPFDADNLLIFGPGLLAGMPVLAANRTIVTTISPPTYLHVHSIMGGFWGPELKHAGYDKVIIRGKSSSLVYLWIDDDKVEIRDASHLAGKTCLQTEALIREELKQPKAQVACIGPAGENRVYMSCIEHGKASASRGVGVIMGDKKLKAIAVHGTKDLNIARPAELFELSNYLVRARKQNPELRREGLGLGSAQWHNSNFAWGNARHRRKDVWTEEFAKNQYDLAEKLTVRNVACYNCPDRCTTVISYPGYEIYFLKCMSRWSYMWGTWDPAHPSDQDFGYRMLSICQNLGLDGYSTPQTMAFAFELYEAGILTEQDMAGMPSDTEGRSLWLLDKIVRREGIGDILADGTYWAARRIGKGAEAYAHNNIKKLEQLPIKVSMLNYIYYLMWTTGEKATITQIEGSYPQDTLPTREQREEYLKDWTQIPEKFKQYFLDWEPRSFPTIQAACDVCDWNEAMHYVDDATGLCAFWSAFVQKPEYHYGNIPDFISAATGMDIDEAELLRIARRNRTLVRGINARLGLRRSDEQVPETHYKHRFPEVEAQLTDTYYKLKGWNKEGIPTRETLDELGLDYVSQDLERRGILATDGKGAEQASDVDYVLVSREIEQKGMAKRRKESTPDLVSAKG